MVSALAVCSTGKSLGPLGLGCYIVRKPALMLCEHKRLYHRAAIPDVLGIYRPNCHQPCVMNELVSIHNRVCGEVPEPSKRGLVALAKTREIIARQFPILCKQDLDSIPLHYFGAKRTRYQQAVDDLKCYPLVPRDATIKAFIKAEKTDFSRKENPDPRMIQARSMRYNCFISQYLNPIEQWIYHSLEGPYTGLPLIGKCLNQKERAELLIKKASHFKHPVFISLDAFRFDQHVSRELLQLEHSMYLRFIPCRVFAWLLRMQLDNKCTTRNRICYKTRGKRMSGDKNTASGNCLLTILMIWTVMRQLGIGKWDCLDDGDDCLLILEAGQYTRFRANCDRLFLAFGHEIKVENVAYQLCDIEWCQCKLIEIRPGEWRFIRKYDKVLSSTLTGVTHWQQPDVVDYVYTLGVCELILSQGVPILQEFALAIMRNAMGGKVCVVEENDSIAYRTFRELRTHGLRTIERVDPLPITTEARLTFEQAFGVPTELQKTYESCLARWSFDVRERFVFGQEWTATGGWHNEFVPRYEVSLARGDE